MRTCGFGPSGVIFRRLNYNFVDFYEWCDNWLLIIFLRFAVCYSTLAPIRLAASHMMPSYSEISLFLIKYKVLVLSPDLFTHS